MRPSAHARVCLLQLGCPKNLIDGEIMLGLAQREGFELVPEPAQAELVIINTCAFLAAAEEEAILTILEVAALKRARPALRLLVAGCLPERHGRRLLEEIPEIDGLLGPGRLSELPAVLSAMLDGREGVALGGFPCAYPEGVRERTGTPHTAYVKIAEGCSHHCSYCLIPRLRGAQRSRTPDEIVTEIGLLADEGVREIVLVAQDTTAYGRDLPERPSLAGLLRRLLAAPGPEWIRVLYTHPAHWDEELIELFAEGGRLLPYVDLPIQHISERVLRAMSRSISAGSTRALLERLRERIPNLVLRTTLITGHPHEEEAEFEELLGFIREFPFDRLGAFAYSPEDGTRAVALRPRASAGEAECRRRQLLGAQREIARELQQRRKGTHTRALIEGVDPERGLLVGRSYAEAPEIDGVLYVKRSPADPVSVEPGEFLNVRILAAGPYDLVAVADTGRSSSAARCGRD